MDLDREGCGGVDRVVGYDLRNRMDCLGVVVYLSRSCAHYLASLSGG